MTAPTLRPRRSARGRPTATSTRPEKVDPWRPVNLARFLPAEQAFSRIYQGRRELIDHILVSTELARRTLDVSVDTAHVVSIGDQPAQRKKAVWPDHAPVLASIS